MTDMRKLLKIIEQADFDVNTRDQGHQLKSIGGKDNTGMTDGATADIPCRRTSARYGDNPIKDETKEELDEFEDGFNGFSVNTPALDTNAVPDRNSGVVDRALGILRKAGISDDEIRAGIDLTATGRQKLAAQLGLSAEEVPMLLASTATRLRDDDDGRSIRALESAYKTVMESDEQYGYEKDANGNVTIRDSQTGKETYLQGSQATDLLSQLEQHPNDEQAILSGFQPIMEDDEDDYLREMKEDTGTVNFPWKVGSVHGTATARYKFGDAGMEISLMSVRDSSGDAMKANPKLKAQIEALAKTFIEEEND